MVPLGINEQRHHLYIVRRHSQVVGGCDLLRGVKNSTQRARIVFVLAFHSKFPLFNTSLAPHAHSPLLSVINFLYIQNCMSLGFLIVSYSIIGTT